MNGKKSKVDIEIDIEKTFNISFRDNSMVDKGYPLKSFSSLIETSSKAAPGAGQDEVVFEDHEKGHSLEAMSSQDHDLSPKYSSSSLQGPML